MTQMEVVQLLQMQFMQLARNSETTRAAFIALMALPTYIDNKLTDKVHRLVWYGSDYQEPHTYDGNYWTEKDFHCLCVHFALQLAGVDE